MAGNLEIDKIKEYLTEYGINDIKIDAVLVKRLAATNIHPENTRSASSNQTHIAITGEEKHVFPFITNTAYLNGQTSDKPYFQIKVKLITNNLHKLMQGKSQDRQYNFGDSQIIDTTTTCFVRAGEQIPQIQLSALTLDDPKFINFRKLLNEGDYLIVVKSGYNYYFLGESNIGTLGTGVYY